MNVISWKTLLVIGSMITLVGCQSLATERLKLPTKPTLQATTKADGSVCFSKEDATAIGTYIIELERR